MAVLAGPLTPSVPKRTGSSLTGSAAAPLATAVATVLVVGGGGALASGRGVRIGAGALVLFLIPATVRHLVVAGDIDPGLQLADLARRGQLASAAKNLALIALMAVFVGGRSDPSLRHPGPVVTPDSAER